LGRAVREQGPADAGVVARAGRVEAVAADGLDGARIPAPQALKRVHQLAARAEVVGRDALVVTAVAEDDPVEVADPRPGEEPEGVIVIGVDAVGRVERAGSGQGVPRGPGRLVRTGKPRE